MTGRLAIAAGAGALFGLGLLVGGMTDTARVLGFFDLFGNWDPTLAFVMAGAILPMAVAWRLAARRGLAVALRPPGRRADAGLVAGSLLFGVGWGLVGLCPGPAMAAALFGGLPILVFLAAMLAAMVAAPRLARGLERIGAVARPEGTWTSDD